MSLRTSGISCEGITSTSDFALRLNWIGRSPAYRHVTKTKQVPTHWQCDWVRALCKACKLYGWVAVSPWKFHHLQLGFITFHPQNLEKRDLVLHKLRESFRRFHFYKHVNGRRRDACHGTRYTADRCAWVRNRACKELCAFQVLTGATVSPAAFEK